MQAHFFFPAPSLDPKAFALPLSDTMKDDIVDADALRLAQLGHEQSFERQFSKWTMLGLAFAILNSWTALAASLSLALPSGGPIAVVWVS